MKRSLAYFSPLPPDHTGIADYSGELLPHLARLADVALFTDEHDRITDPELTDLLRFPPDAYAARRWDYDLALYHMGNSAYHAAIGRTLLRYPGVMVLHDYGLHQLWAGQTVAAGDSAAYAREMGYALGPRGAAWAAEVAAGRRPMPHFDAALNERFVDTALGVIVHSEYVAQLIRQRNARQRIVVVPAPIGQGQAPSLRPRLGLPADACLFGSFGFVSHTKQLEASLSAFQAVRRQCPHSYYLIVGEWRADDVDVPALVERLGLADAVRITGYSPSLEEFLGWLAAVDVVVNLRCPTVGETSASALRALVAGRSLVVNDHGWYAELPADACLKVPPLNQDALTTGLLRLAQDPELRASLGRAGQAYARTSHAPVRAAADYLAFVERVLTGAGGHDASSGARGSA
jgi:glycosyltransferase involved in cell wall biosynthesis